MNANKTISNLNNTTSSYNWKSYHIPTSLLGEEIVIGIDEAGRGPVLGSLVYTLCFWKKEDNEEFKSLGFKDSKQLKENERELLLKKLLIDNKDRIGYIIKELKPSYLSSNMLGSNSISLNELSYQAVIEGLTFLLNYKNEEDNNNDFNSKSEENLDDIKSESIDNNKQYKNLSPIVSTLYVDTVGDPSFYQRKIILGVTRASNGNSCGLSESNVIVEKKADSKYHIVSAASIIAKQTRDLLLLNSLFNPFASFNPSSSSSTSSTSSTSSSNPPQLFNNYYEKKEFNYQLNQIKKKYNNNKGSGYPGDENTLTWMKDIYDPFFGFPDLVRFSWSTTEEMLKTLKAVQIDWECDEENKGTGNLLSMFSSQTSKKRTRTNYFSKRKFQKLDLNELSK